MHVGYFGDDNTSAHISDQSAQQDQGVNQRHRYGDGQRVPQWVLGKLQFHELFNAQISRIDGQVCGGGESHCEIGSWVVEQIHVHGLQFHVVTQDGGECGHVADNQED